MPHRILLFSFLIASLIAGCNSQQALLEEAQKLETAGLHLEALEKYATIFQTDPSNVDAQIGAKKEANILLNQKVSKAKGLLNSEQFDACLNQLNSVEDILFQYQWLNLDRPMMLDLTRSEAKAAKAKWLYVSAEQAVLNEQYDAAKTYLNQLHRLQPDNQEALYLTRMMEIIPNYNKGVKAMELGLFREGFGYFKTVTDIDADFKDALSRLNQCRDEAAFTIAFLSKNRKNYNEQLNNTLTAEIKKYIVNLNDPLIKLVDRDHLDDLLAEQQQMMEAGFDESSVVEAGQFLGAEYVVIGELVNYNETTGRLVAVEKKGWLGTSLKSSKTKYMQYTQKRVLEGGFRYQLMNAETGEVIAAGNLPFCVDDEIHFAKFNGNDELLYPGYWKYQLIGSSQDYIEYDSESKASLEELLSGRDQLKSVVDLQFQLADEVAEQVANEIQNFAGNR